MGRKLVKHGESTLMVSLPAKWLKRHGYKRGDEVEIAEREGELVIGRNAKRALLKRVSLDLGPEGFGLYRSLISSYYRFGYDEIDIRLSSRESLADVQKVVDSLYGAEITEMSERSCTIKSIHSDSETEPEKTLAKILILLKAMQNTILEDISKKSFESRSDMLEYRNNVLKQRDLIARHVHKSASEKDFPYYNLGYNMYSIARCYYHLYRELDKERIKPGQVELLKRTGRLLDAVFDRKRSFASKFSMYERLANHGRKLVAEGGAISSYSLFITMIIQSCISSIELIKP